MLKLLDLFSGIGGFSLGLERSGLAKTVAFCEIDPWSRRVLARHWPSVPCYDDVVDISARSLASDGIVPDAICGGFPCQDLSFAGRRLGLAGARSGLWWEFWRLIGDIRPRVVIVENVTGLLDFGMGDVLGGLAALGYDCVWDCVPASAVGAPHRRDRVFIVAYPASKGREGLIKDDGLSVIKEAPRPELMHTAFNGWDALVADSADVRSGDGISVGVDRRRMKALGNAVVPQVAEMIGRAIIRSGLLKGDYHEKAQDNAA